MSIKLKLKPKFKECDLVEVVVEKDKYTKHGVHCGDRGFIVLNEMIKMNCWLILLVLMKMAKFTEKKLV